MKELTAMILAGLAIYGTISLIWYIIMIIANWQVFTKAGEAGWKSIIPFLNTFVVFKISWNTMMFWAMLAASVLGSVLTGFAGEDGGILTILALICYIVAQTLQVLRTWHWIHIGPSFLQPYLHPDPWLWKV